MGLYLRGSTWWATYTAHGVRQYETTDTADKRIAASFLSARRRELREGTWKPRGESRETLTVGEYIERWIARRREAGVLTWDKEADRLRRFVVPVLGEKKLGDVKRPDVVALVAEVSKAKIKNAKKGEEPRTISPRSILHVYSALRTMYADAVVDELVAASPCTLRTKRGELPTKKDRDPTWRARAVFTREEAETLLSSEIVPVDRQVFYALGFLTGMRAGEIIGRRWRDWDAVARPLGSLLVATQYDDADTKTERTRQVPVHPTLAAILAAWRLHGWPAMFKRQATPDDWILPARDDVGGQRTIETLHRLHDDMRRLELPRNGRGRHAMRATFITLAQTDGARREILEAVTHGGRGDVFAGYSRWSWAALCDEVSKLRLSRRGTLAAIPFRPGSDRDNHRDMRGRWLSKGLESGLIEASPGGVEAGSSMRPSAAFQAPTLENAASTRARSEPEKTGSERYAVQSVTLSRSVVVAAVDRLRALGATDEADALERDLEASAKLANG